MELQDHQDLGNLNRESPSRIQISKQRHRSPQNSCICFLCICTTQCGGQKLQTLVLLTFHLRPSFESPGQHCFANAESSGLLANKRDSSFRHETRTTPRISGGSGARKSDVAESGKSNQIDQTISYDLR
jgi:hypothetical protein